MHARHRLAYAALCGGALEARRDILGFTYNREPLDRSVRYWSKESNGTRDGAEKGIFFIRGDDAAMVRVAPELIGKFLLCLRLEPARADGASNQWLPGVRPCV